MVFIYKMGFAISVQLAVQFVLQIQLARFANKHLHSLEVAVAVMPL
jgi:hypothetical protein